MPCIKYKEVRFSPDRLAIVRDAIRLVTTYRQAGYHLTLRQLYYQFVAKDLFPASWADPVTGSPNNERSYKKLGDIIADARLAGKIDWEAIEDRTREVAGVPHWSQPSDIVEACAQQFRLDKWTSQKHRVEVWVEKDALEGVVGKAARELDIQYFSCRGYASMTSIWDAGQRLKAYAENEQIPVILHLGDHDPSGIDMSRDIEERVRMFMEPYGDSMEFKRIALNLPQIKQYAPPPNPAKTTDSRFKKYREEYGDESWELDALDPQVIHDLVLETVQAYRDDDAFGVRQSEEERNRGQLQEVANQWERITEML